MKKLILFFFICAFIFPVNTYSQTLVASFDFPNFSPYNSFWGITVKSDSLWVGTDFTSTLFPYSKLYRVSKTGVISDSISTPYKFNHGLVWDGSGFWIAESYRSSGARIYKMNSAGVQIDSIYTGTYAQGIGGLALDGNNLWFAVYYPDNTTYPYTKAYKINITTKLVTDSIPLRGKQVQGIAVKGDTLFYVTDNFQGDNEKIYAFSKSIGDTLFSFAVPDPDGDCDPRGLVWDGQNLWLIANRVGGSANQYRTLYKYVITGAGSPIITTSTNSMDFGNTIIGTTSNQTLSISNVGTAKLILSGKTLTNTRFGINPSTVPDTINPGQSKDFTVSFTPNVYDTTSGQLRISSNDFGNPLKTIALKGKGVFSGSYISLSDSVYNYGTRRAGSLCGWKFSVLNAGTGSLILSGISFNNLNFKLDTLGLTFPVTIDTQKVKTFRVWYTPSPLTSSGIMSINSNAINSPVKNVSLTGTGMFMSYQLGNILWQGTVPDNPSTVYNDYKPVSMKQISDVNGDGISDVLVASNNYLVSCFNGNASLTADVLWSFNSSPDNNNSGSVTFEEAMQVRDDINGDGIKDVVIGCGGGNELVYTISGRSGQVIWAYGDSTTSEPLGAINGVKVDKDYSGDGVYDVLVSASGTGDIPPGRHAVICVNGLNGNLIFYTTQASQFLYDVATSQTGGVASLSNNGGPYSVQGFDNSGTNTWNYSSADIVWNLKSVPSITSDTIKDIVGFAGFSSRVFALNGSTGAQIWNNQFGYSVGGTVIDFTDTTHGNNIKALAFSGPRSINIIDRMTGNPLLTNGLDSSYVLGVSKLNYYHLWNPMVIAVTLNNHVYVLSTRGSSTGQIVFQYSFGSGSPTNAAEKVTDLKSIDGSIQNDNADEFVAGCRDGRIVCFAGGYFLTPYVNQIGSSVPGKFALEQNYPNPFNPETKIKFSVPASSSVNLISGNNVQLRVFDILGREVKTLVKESLKPGNYEVTFNASQFSSGMYFYKLEAGSFVETKKMILIK